MAELMCLPVPAGGGGQYTLEWQIKPFHAPCMPDSGQLQPFDMSPQFSFHWFGHFSPSLCFHKSFHAPSSSSKCSLVPCCTPASVTSCHHCFGMKYE
ncbi:hypothetical protein DIPPA_06466 [Diplonema papillatum]|nr:hypothetical protein DIPPA_06466 [Diplonema papillatum]